MRCPNCSYNDLQFLFVKYDESNNVTTRVFRCPNCHKEYTSIEMLVDEKKSVINEVEFLRSRYQRDQEVIKDTREELSEVLRKLESAKRILDGVIIEDFDPIPDD